MTGRRGDGAIGRSATSMDQSLGEEGKDLKQNGNFKP